ncbi:hypothetical protein L195_g048352, partial [Trifolium pratense]
VLLLITLTMVVHFILLKGNPSVVLNLKFWSNTPGRNL